MPDHPDALGPRFCDPCLALAALHLTHVGIFAIAREALELLGYGVEAHNRVRCPVGQPNLIIRIHPYRIGSGFLAGKLPLLPSLVHWIVDADVSGVPLTDPQPPFRIRPHTARALIPGRRLVAAPVSRLTFAR